MVTSPLANSGDLGFILGSGRSPGGENGNPLQYSCLINPTDRGIWWATVHGGHRTVTHDLIAKTTKNLSKVTKRRVTNEGRFITSNQQNEGLQWTSVCFCLGGRVLDEGWSMVGATPGIVS